MVTREDLLEYVRKEHERRGNNPDDKPIFSLFLFEHPDKERIYDMKDGSKKPSGFPDTGGTYEPGFYYNLDHAIEAMNENACDIRETCYNAGFILCRFAGMYECCGSYARMYFVWDDEKKGFFQQEEPDIFKHIAY